MKWKKDPFYDSIDILLKDKELRPLISLKNIIAKDPAGCVPISTVSKQNRILEVSGRVASFLRKYPAVFEEFTGPKYNLPWFKLTQEAADLDRKEREVFAANRLEIVDRLRRLILMSKEKRLPMRIVQGMLWYLGLPEDYLINSEEFSNGYFQIVKMEDGEQGLSASIGSNEQVLSVLQRNALNLNGNMGSPPSIIEFPLFHSKGLRLKNKIEIWLEEFQKVKYISPYEDFSRLDPNSDVSQKRVAEAYCAGSTSAIQKHPLLEVREEYVKLMNKSQTIRRSWRSGITLKTMSKENQDSSLNLKSTESLLTLECELKSTESPEVGGMFMMDDIKAVTHTIYLTPKSIDDIPRWGVTILGSSRGGHLTYKDS
ncbi:hypothetical protein Cni_G05683 [Canna indica]|uniref:PORR domain-containing protein n=1 Tax=Canna indica TaxID=4628 RepID=A0AAQ3Q3F7_9LILI|nr:hypothetical protein Cni_G05683 [Canna indica]